MCGVGARSTGWSTFRESFSIGSESDETRVSSPPKDQQHVDRLGLLYFSRFVLPSPQLGLEWKPNFNDLGPITMSSSQQSKSLQYSSARVTSRISSSRPVTLCLQWKVRMTVCSDCGLCLSRFHRAEWTFAKQKWQRTKNIVRGDQNHENAEILPGWNEKRYA